MIIAIDETGTFTNDSSALHLFSAIHLRKEPSIYKTKEHQFLNWESSLPCSLKNHNGEIKSSSLSDEQLTDFAHNVISSNPKVNITPCAFIPAETPSEIVDKYKALLLNSIYDIYDQYKKQNNNRLSQDYLELGNWLKKLNYTQYVKILVMGKCIISSLSNSIFHSIAEGYDHELPELEFLIDKDFINQPRHKVFWLEILRNQLISITNKYPIPTLDRWEEDGHPFFDKYLKNGKLDMKELFLQHLDFYSSHEYFEIRIADAVNTILNRYMNQNKCIAAYNSLRELFCNNKRIHQIILIDFDLNIIE